ncbi:MAG: hypothetical protein HC906_17255 [Bacteroidales bacterium]|nr:hypothetical protein [Bacteroidales bacterium]
MGLKKSDNDFKWLKSVMDEDKKYLLKNGVHAFDIQLIIDYLKFFPQ